MVNTATRPALGPAAAGSLPGYEPPFWQCAGAVWCQLAGSFSRDGFSFEWHELQPPANMNWANGFHPASAKSVSTSRASGGLSPMVPVWTSAPIPLPSLPPTAATSRLNASPANTTSSLAWNSRSPSFSTSSRLTPPTFTRETGLTISQWLRHARLQRAAELLRTRKSNVTEASLEVGYSSLSHFSQAFHEMFGCCPALYPLRTPSQQTPPLKLVPDA